MASQLLPARPKLERRRRTRRTTVALFGICAVALSLLPAAPAEADQPRWGQWWFDTWSIESKVWSVSKGDGVIVAVLDSGVDGKLRNLKGRVLPGTGFESRPADDAGANGPLVFPDGFEVLQSARGNRDKTVSQHGTHMAQLIAGRGHSAELNDHNLRSAGNGMVGAGLAPRAKILPVDITGGTSSVTTVGSFDHAVPADIRWAVDQGAQVISLSLASERHGGCPEYHARAIAYAVEHDVVVVAGAGNEGDKGNPVEAPASCPGALAVGAVDRHGKTPPWTQRQPYVAVIAPGVDIPVVNRPWYDGTQAELTRGTSNSTALVAGVVALMRSKYPNMPAREVVQRIINTTDKPAQGTPKKAAGAGIVNPRRALDVEGYPVPADAPNPVYASFDEWLASPGGRRTLRGHYWPGTPSNAETYIDRCRSDPQSVLLGFGTGHSAGWGDRPGPRAADHHCGCRDEKETLAPESTGHTTTWLPQQQPGA